MAVLKLNNVTTLTESSGALTLANAALGTPTSGVMTNMTGTPSAITLTNATFPAGSVVQVQGNSMASSSASTGTGTIITQAITLIDHANNDVLITASGQFTKDTGGDTAHLAVYINGGSQGATSSGYRTSAQGLYQQGNEHEETLASTYWDTAPGAASVTYGIYLLCNNSLVGTTRWSITLYEIKR